MMPQRKAPRTRLSGSVQVGPAVLIMEGRGPDYPDGSPCYRYRVEAPVLPNWGNIPKPGAVWVFNRGMGPRTEDELRRDYASQLQSGGLYEFKGYEDEFPYVRAAG